MALTKPFYEAINIIFRIINRGFWVAPTGCIGSLENDMGDWAVASEKRTDTRLRHPEYTLQLHKNMTWYRKKNDNRAFEYV